MKLSVVIPTKNEALYLPLLLSCIREQYSQPDEIIVADAGSTDKTRSIAKKAGAKVVPGGMPGPGRNRGAEHAQGEYLIFLDADVLLPSPDFMKDCLQEMQKRKLDVAACPLKVQEGTLIDDALHTAYNAYTKVVQTVLPHATGCCIIAKRSVHQAIGGFDESVVFAEDHDYIRRAHKAKYKTGIIKSHHILISPRRYRKDGMVKTAAKFIWCEAYILMKGPFHKMPFSYEFGVFGDHVPQLKRKTKTTHNTPSK